MTIFDHQTVVATKQFACNHNVALVEQCQTVIIFRRARNKSQFDAEQTSPSYLFRSALNKYWAL